MSDPVVLLVQDPNDGRVLGIGLYENAEIAKEVVQKGDVGVSGFTGIITPKMNTTSIMRETTKGSMLIPEEIKLTPEQKTTLSDYFSRLRQATIDEGERCGNCYSYHGTPMCEVGHCNDARSPFALSDVEVDWWCPRFEAGTARRSYFGAQTRRSKER